MDAFESEEVKNAIGELGTLMGQALKFGAKILPDVIGAITWLMKKVQGLVNLLGGDAKAGLLAFVGVLGAMKLASGLASFGMTSLVSRFTPLGKATKAATDAANKAAEGTKAIAEAKAKEMAANTSSIGPQTAATTSTTTAGKAAAWSGKQMMALGFAILMMGAAIAIAAFGLSYLVESFKGLTGPQALGAVAALVVVMGGFILMLYAMIPVITALGSVTYAVGPALIALGLAFLLIGAGIGLAAWGMSKLVDAFYLLSPEQAMAAVAAIQIVMTSILVGLALMIPIIFFAAKANAGLAISLVALGAAFALASLAALPMAAALWVLSWPLADISEDLMALMSIIKTPAEEGAISPISKLTKELKAAIPEIDAFTDAWIRMTLAINRVAINPKPTIITTIMMERLFGSISSVGPQSAASTVRVIEKAKEYQKEVVKNKDNVDALVELLKAKGDVPGGGAGGGASLDGAVIRLEVGGNQFGDYIIKTQQQYAEFTGQGQHFTAKRG
jgi:hypothetical protein